MLYQYIIALIVELSSFAYKYIKRSEKQTVERYNITIFQYTKKIIKFPELTAFLPYTQNTYYHIP